MWIGMRNTASTNCNGLTSCAGKGTIFWTHPGTDPGTADDLTWPLADVPYIDVWVESDSNDYCWRMQEPSDGYAIETSNSCYDNRPFACTFACNDTLPAGSDISYVGCFMDYGSSNRQMPCEEQEFATTNTPEVCAQHCADNGFAYSGTQVERQCFCFDEAPPDAAAEADCNRDCRGDASLTCGGANRLSVYYNDSVSVPAFPVCGATSALANAGAAVVTDHLCQADEAT